MKPQPSTKVSYKKNGLVITIAEANPAYLHSQLLQGLALSMKNYILASPQNESDADKQLCIIQLLENLLPDEKILSANVSVE